jgi:hypothetical protein
VKRLQLYGDLEHSRACVDKSINGDDNGNFKFNNGKRSVMDATDDETRHRRAFFISAAGDTGNAYLFDTLLDNVRSSWGHEGK